MHFYFSFFITLRLGDSLTFFNQDNGANFLVKKMYNEAIQGGYYLRIQIRKHHSTSRLVRVKSLAWLLTPPRHTCQAPVQDKFFAL